MTATSALSPAPSVRSVPPTQLPIARLRLSVRADAPLALPPYAGSMLRGAFGHALKAFAPLPHEDNQPCALHERCAYCQVFAPPPLPEHSLQKFSQMPNPYVIEPPENDVRQLRTGQTFTFGLVLIGKALTHLPTLVLAFERAMRTGLGSGHQQARCTLLAVHQEGQHAPLWQAGERTDRLDASRLDTRLPPAAPLTRQAILHLRGPLRMQYQGKPTRQDNITARTLLITLARRWQLLMDIHLGAAAPQQDFATLGTLAEAIRLDASGLRWFDWGRFSQRQQREMKLGGLIGQLTLHGDLTPFSELLHLGQWLHVGKNASFGLGGYSLQTTALPLEPSGAPYHQMNTA